MHWADKCPHRNDKGIVMYVEEDENSENDSSEEINIVLMTEKISKSEIIDTACTKTVAGKQWFDNFKANLTKHSLDEIQYFPKSTRFKFGDGRKVQSTMRVIFPVMLAGKYCKINAEIVDENIPLLLSKSSVRRCQTNINICHHKATIFNKEIQLHQSTSGHYCIDILPKLELQQPMSEVVLMLEATLPSKEKSKQIDKIHKQLGHASIKSMQNLFRNANLLDKNISKLIIETVTKCQTCVKFKKPQPQPVVGLAKSDMFNGTVSIDLYQLKSNLWFMHMNDEFTHYSSAAIISSKTSTAKVFMKYWTAYFGLPKTIFSDNGGEFIGQLFLEMFEQFNIHVRTTTSKSPWSNGQCERHKQTLTKILLKIKDDVGCDYETDLSWTVSAKNTFYNFNGFTPSQLVFGLNATLLNFINNQ